MSKGTEVQKTQKLPEEVQEEMKKLEIERFDRSRGGDSIVQFSEKLQVRWWLAQILANSGMVPDRRPEAVMAKMLKAFELGVPIMQAMATMTFINGRVGLEAKLMDALAVRNCGVTKKVHVSDDKRCSLTLHREGWEPVDVEFTVEEAANAGLIHSGLKADSPWKKWRVDMLYWRALARGLRRIAPDYFAGVYTDDEVNEMMTGAMAKMAGRSSASDELDALETAEDGGDAELVLDAEVVEDGEEPADGVEPLTEAEIDKLRSELNAAYTVKAIREEEGHQLLDWAIEGEWAKVRAGWDQVRQAMLQVEEPAGAKKKQKGKTEQGDLL